MYVLLLLYTLKQVQCVIFVKARFLLYIILQEFIMSGILIRTVL